MKCTICGKPIVLIPSAEERARRDVSGKGAAYYRGLFTEHSECLLKKRHSETSDLMRRIKTT